MNQETISRRVLLIDEEPKWLDFGAETLTKAGHFVKKTKNTLEAGRILQEEDFDLVLIDQREAERARNAIQCIVLSQARRRRHVVVLFPTTLTPSKMRTMFKLGVYDCVDKQYCDMGLLKLVDQQLAEISGILTLQPGV